SLFIDAKSLSPSAILFCRCLLRTSRRFFSSALILTALNFAQSPSNSPSASNILFSCSTSIRATVTPLRGVTSTRPVPLNRRRASRIGVRDTPNFRQILGSSRRAPGSTSPDRMAFTSAWKTSSDSVTAVHRFRTDTYTILWISYAIPQRRPMCGTKRCAVALRALGLALLILLVLVLPSMAQTWPQRPVKFIVTLGPGSGVDFGTRLLGDRLSKRWGQPVVIENRPGGDAVVAVTAVISANDDHVLLASPTSALTAHPYMLQQMPYQDSDLLPIARGWNTIIVIAVPTSMDVKTVRDLVAMTRANPGKLNWAGTTSAIDFLFAGFLKKNNLEMARVPYR